MSDCDATAAGVGAARAPLVTSGWALSGLRFQTTGFWPWSSKRETMAAPIRPRPQNPIRMAMSPVGCAPCLMASRPTVKHGREKRWPRSGGGNLAGHPQVTGELHALGILEHDFD